MQRHCSDILQESEMCSQARVNISQAEQQCVICGLQLRLPRVIIKVGKVSLVTCPGCQSWISLPRPIASEQSAIHDTSEYFEHPYFEQRRNKQRTIEQHCHEIFGKIEVALSCGLQGSTVLDIGCDTGAFLACAAKQYGIVPFGIDVSSRAVQLARRTGLNIYQGTIDVIPTSQKFKIITVTDVVEHVPDPALLLRQIHDHLDPGGVVYIQTPNMKSTIYQLGRLFSGFAVLQRTGVAERLFPPQHIQYFSRQGLVDLIKSRDFAVVNLETRILRPFELGVSKLMFLPLTILQFIDMLLGRQILLCALLKKL